MDVAVFGGGIGAIKTLGMEPSFPLIEAQHLLQDFFKKISKVSPEFSKVSPEFGRQ
jgi:hypothetical protein